MPFLVFRRDHLRSASEIICGSGSFAVQFGDHFRAGNHLRSGIICGAIQIAIDVSRVFILALAKCLSIQKFILGKVCLKAVVKVAVSLQRIASARQVKISNHTMIVPRKKLPSSCTLNK